MAAGILFLPRFFGLSGRPAAQSVECPVHVDSVKGGRRKVGHTVLSTSRTLIGVAWSQHCALRPSLPALRGFVPSAFAFFLLCTTSLSGKTYTPPATHRADLLLDTGWRFI